MNKKQFPFQVLFVQAQYIITISWLAAIPSSDLKSLCSLLHCLLSKFFFLLLISKNDTHFRMRNVIYSELESNKSYSFLIFFFFTLKNLQNRCEEGEKRDLITKIEIVSSLLYLVLIQPISTKFSHRFMIFYNLHIFLLFLRFQPYSTIMLFLSPFFELQAEKNTDSYLKKFFFA